MAHNTHALTPDHTHQRTRTHSAHNTTRIYTHTHTQGLNIITPNKKLGSGPLQQYQAVRKMQRESYIHFFYEVRAAMAFFALRDRKNMVTCLGTSPHIA